MGWVAARLRAGPIPTLRSLWHGPSLRRTEGGRRERCERLKGARNAACGRRRRISPGLALPAPSEAPPRAPCARTSPATRTAPAFRVSKGAKGSVCPVGCCAQRKATRRREQIQGLCAAAHRTPIFATVREARMIEQPGHKKRGLRQAAAHNAAPCVPAPSEAPPRAPAPVAAGASPRPPLAPCARTIPATRTAQAFRAPLRRKKRASPHPAAHIAGPLARTTRQEVRRARGPSELKSESSDMRGGFGSLASARQPYAGRRPAKSTAQPLTK